MRSPTSLLVCNVCFIVPYLTAGHIIVRPFHLSVHLIFASNLCKMFEELTLERHSPL